MPLTCPICGKEYFHDRKICQICESKLIQNRLVSNDIYKPQKWNCGIFLEFDTSAFGKHKPTDFHIKIASEPKFSDFKPKKEYIWNCASKIGYKKSFTLKAELSRLRTIKKLPTTSSRIFKRDVSTSFIYE